MMSVHIVSSCINIFTSKNYSGQFTELENDLYSVFTNCDEVKQFKEMKGMC